ncbi:hypothetical protein ACU4HD_02830 [Cupriavidus basilensis]
MTANYILPCEEELKPTAQEQLSNRLRARVARVTGMANLMFLGDFQALDDGIQTELIALLDELADNAYSAAVEASDALAGAKP